MRYCGFTGIIADRIEIWFLFSDAVLNSLPAEMNEVIYFRVVVTYFNIRYHVIRAWLSFELWTIWIA